MIVDGLLCKLLALLHDGTPRFFELAELVGKWVWITFTEEQTSDVTRVLAELGFHWNNNRQTWQHPCGTIPIESATYDPRKRYGSYFAADQQAGVCHEPPPPFANPAMGIRLHVRHFQLDSRDCD